VTVKKVHGRMEICLPFCREVKQVAWRLIDNFTQPVGDFYWLFNIGAFMYDTNVHGMVGKFAD